MAETRRDIKYTSLDFDDIKESLIDYIVQHKTFNGANFEGSGLNLLSDLLAYITHMTAVTANMCANEMFMDSAQLRQSIVSKAKELGYCPISVKPPKATIRVRFYAPEDIEKEHVFIPIGTQFGTKYETVFSTKEDYQAYPVDSRDVVRKVKVAEKNAQGIMHYVTKEVTVKESIYEAEIDIYEGWCHNYTYTVDLSNSDQRFYIPDVNADMSTLSVVVQKHSVANQSSQLIIYHENENLSVLTPDSEVYFLHQNPDNIYEVTFGDGILGKPLENGDKVILNYVVSNKGMEMNGVDYFSKVEIIDNISDYEIITVEAAKDGYEQESGDQIRFRASKMWKAQNRAVTKDDYQAILLSQYPWIDTVSVWGGQYHNPPQYGKVYFCIKPKHVPVLSNGLKEKIKEELIKKYNVLTMIPEIVDPEYIYVGVRTSVIYDTKKSPRNFEDISETIQQRIIQYFKDTVEDFNMTLYYSPLISIIDSSDVAIVSSKTTFFLSKWIYPRIHVNERHIFSFSNSIVPGTLRSSRFNTGDEGIYIGSYFADDEKGNIHIMSSQDTYFSVDNAIFPNVGYVNYETGECEITFTPYELSPSGNIKIYADPVNDNIEQKAQEIIMKDVSTIDSFWGVKNGTEVTMSALPLIKK